MCTSGLIMLCVLSFILGFALATRRELSAVEKELQHWCRESETRELEKALADKTKEFDKLKELLRQ